MLTLCSTSTDGRLNHAALSPGRLQTPRGVRIVALGGGTGLPALLRGLKKVMFASAGSDLPEEERRRLTAIVTTADDGGSSGRLREAYGTLPPGDIRNCLLALSCGDPRMPSLFDFRFGGNGGLGGHSLGNLILTAMSLIESDLLAAIEWASTVLNVSGCVLPASLESLTLGAEYEDGSHEDGESRIAAVRRPIQHVSICPAGARALPQAVHAIDGADLIVIGPGSLYTSIMPILLIGEIAEAIERSMARVVLVLNLMTEPGETDGYSATDFVSAVRHHAPRLRVSDVLINSTPIPGDVLERYAAQGAGAIRVELDPLRLFGCAPILCDQMEGGRIVRHDPFKLGHAVLELAEEAMRCAIPV